jgi:2-amino-4-hydroxy-6-hydroxymethyldihydropteridine diphosphokinase
MQYTVFIALGSNLGDRRANLEAALRALEAEQIVIAKCSSVYETKPRDYLQQPWFLNMVLECATVADPLALLGKLLRIERDLGRERITAIERGPRIIDLDILLFGELVVNSPQLQIPHPRILQRRFVLEPLLEIAPNLCHPVSGHRIADSLPAVLDQEIGKAAKGLSHRPVTGAPCKPP